MKILKSGIRKFPKKVILSQIWSDVVICVYKWLYKVKDSM
jgi:hypothetical protein